MVINLYFRFLIKKFNNINFSQNIFSPEILFIFNALLVGKILNSNKMVYFKEEEY